VGPTRYQSSNESDANLAMVRLTLSFTNTVGMAILGLRIFGNIGDAKDRQSEMLRL
jgi:hypothetical protein